MEEYYLKSLQMIKELKIKSEFQNSTMEEKNARKFKIYIANKKI